MSTMSSRASVARWFGPKNLKDSVFCSEVVFPMVKPPHCVVELASMESPSTAKGAAQRRLFKVCVSGLMSDPMIDTISQKKATSKADKAPQFKRSTKHRQSSNQPVQPTVAASCAAGSSCAVAAGSSCAVSSCAVAAGSSCACAFVQ